MLLLLLLIYFKDTLTNIMKIVHRHVHYYNIHQMNIVLSVSNQIYVLLSTIQTRLGLSQFHEIEHTTVLDSGDDFKLKLMLSNIATRLPLSSPTYNRLRDFSK